jgi:hypothetical protein
MSHEWDTAEGSVGSPSKSASDDKLGRPPTAYSASEGTKCNLLTCVGFIVRRCLTGQLILGGSVQQLVGAARFLETSNKKDRFSKRQTSLREEAYFEMLELIMVELANIYEAAAKGQQTKPSCQPRKENALQSRYYLYLPQRKSEVQSFNEPGCVINPERNYSMRGEGIS